MEKRLLLAAVLSILCVWAYGSLVRPASKPPPAAESATGAGATGAGTAGAAGTAGTPPASGAPSGSTPGVPGATTLALPALSAPAAPGTPVPFAGQGYVAEFDTRGAGLSWLQLTEHHTSPARVERLRLLGGRGDPIGSFLLRDFEGRYGLEGVLWEVESRQTPAGLAQLVFRHRADDGLLFTRTVTDAGRPCSFELTLSVANESGGPLPGTLLLVLSGAHGLIDDQVDSPLYPAPSAVALIDQGERQRDLEEWSGDDLKEGAPRKLADGERLVAAGVMSNYFSSLLVPADGRLVDQVAPEAVLDGERLELDLRKQLPPGAGPQDEALLRDRLAAAHTTNAAVNLLLPARTLPAAGETVEYGFTVFAGPKDRGLAIEAGYEEFLDPILDLSFGSMAWINHGLLAVMRFFQWLTGNWGVAIILLTVVVRVLLFPLNRVQQATMTKYSNTMQRLKPELDALKAKYKNNVRKFNEEQMKLLKEHGATPPLGGCLLQFIQIPIWYSLFQVLRSSIELRHAPFALWVHDLSRPDAMPLPFNLMGIAHLNLLPVLMAAAMVLQMRMQPKPADDTQAQTQKIMAMIMPVFMLFILYTYPSGLSLYIFTSSVFGILEYRLIRRYWPVPGAPGSPVPAK
jgi:YidC/Oxa1 family membrane protein insertase